MTFDDDMVALLFDGGRRIYACKAFGLDWPPPKTIEVMGFVMKQTRRSQITDKQRQSMTQVCRVAEYKLDGCVPPERSSKE